MGDRARIIAAETTIVTWINAARRVISDSGARQDMIRTVARKGFRFVAAVSDPIEPSAEPATAQREQPSSLRQEIHFCTARDGCRIAYAPVGDRPPLCKSATW